ncbi:MAG: riboflavin synthase [Gemmataceae bacterium]|nr:riboflavin synthase [Gemmataceae bacterium]MCI0740746.1 riboflavin synthase [Gemmataceae bacterium]
MFTGLVETLGEVSAVQKDGAGFRLDITEPRIAKELSLGESVAVNGVCLTVVATTVDMSSFQVGPETLRLTNLGELRTGERVNLERSLKVGDRLGGHIVQGHVDGVGTISQRERQGEWEIVTVQCAAEWTAQMVKKGSIAVDGISLTIVDVGPDWFRVALIPHTMAVTTLGFKLPPARVNLETDLFAKYIAKILKGEG